MINKNKLLILFSLFLFTFCSVEDKSIPFGDSYISLQNAIEYKYKECGNKPNSDFLPPKASQPLSLKLCILAIVRSSCPFNEYPVFCYDLFYEFVEKPN